MSKQRSNTGLEARSAASGVSGAQHQQESPATSNIDKGGFVFVGGAALLAIVSLAIIDLHTFYTWLAFTFTLGPLFGVWGWLSGLIFEDRETRVPLLASIAGWIAIIAVLVFGISLLMLAGLE